MPRPANPDRVKTFKRPPQRSQYYEECMDNCDKINCPKLHYLKCDIPGCNFIASHEEQHSIAHGRLQQHKESGRCRMFQANAIISGNTVNTGGTLVIHNNYNEYPQLSGTLIPQSVATQRTLEKCVNHLVKQSEIAVEAKNETIQAQAKHITEAIKEKEWHIENNKEMRIENRMLREFLYTLAGQINLGSASQGYQNCYNNLKRYYDKECRELYLRLPTDIPELKSCYFREALEVLAETDYGRKLSNKYIDYMFDTLVKWLEWAREWDDNARHDPRKIVFNQINKHHTKKLTINNKNYEQLRKEYPPAQLRDILEVLIAFFEAVYYMTDYRRCDAYTMNYWDDLRDFVKDNELHNSLKKLWDNWIKQQLPDITENKLQDIADYFAYQLPTENERPPEYEIDIDEESELFKEEE